jgi:sirohydrochlorin cobaltochelatase
VRLILCALALLASPLRAATPAPYGILLMAHGGEASWNTEIERLRARVDKKIPTETALGMADPATLQAAVDRLEKRGVARIAAVPLFVQTRSEVLDQTRYALGLADEPSAALKAAYERMASAHAGHAGMAHGGGHSMAFSLDRVKAREPIAMASALDAHPLVSSILLERAKALSREPAKETVVLVAHGPVDDDALPASKASLDALCSEIKARMFKACSYGILRDDAAPEIRAAAVAGLRSLIAGAEGAKLRAIVVPVLIARGGIEKKIEKDLAGLSYAWDGKTLMPHAGFDAWVLESAANAEGSSR